VVVNPPQKPSIYLSKSKARSTVEGTSLGIFILLNAAIFRSAYHAIIHQDRPVEMTPSTDRSLSATSLQARLLAKLWLVLNVNAFVESPLL